MESLGAEVSKSVCEHFAYSRQELYQIAKVSGASSFKEMLHSHGEVRLYALLSAQNACYLILPVLRKHNNKEHFAYSRQELYQIAKVSGAFFQRDAAQPRRGEASCAAVSTQYVCRLMCRCSESWK